MWKEILIFASSYTELAEMLGVPGARSTLKNVMIRILYIKIDTNLQ